MILEFSAVPLEQSKSETREVTVVETKRGKELKSVVEGKNNRHNIYRKDGQEGVMMITRQNLKVTEVRYGNDSAKMMAVQVLVRGGGKSSVITTNAPPKTKS